MAGISKTWTADDSSVRVGFCQRRAKGYRGYKLVTNIIGISPDYAIAPKELRRTGKKLAAMFNLPKRPDYIVGFAAAGIPITVSVALALDIPALIAYKTRLDLPYEISWKEPHSQAPDLFVYGLQDGMSVVLIDDEVDSGRTLVNAIKSLSAASITVYDIGCVVEVLHDGVLHGRRLLQEEGFILKSIMVVDIEN